MADIDAKKNWGKAFRHALGAVLCLLAGATVWSGAPWYVSLGVVSVGAMFVIGSDRRIFRVGVRRSGSEIICRYLPWYEGFTYFVGILFGGLGIACVGAGFASGNAMWLRFAGLILLVLSALVVVLSIAMWRRCLLCITRETLCIRGVAGARDLAEIRREVVRSIQPKVVESTLGSQSLKVEIMYELDGASGTTSTVLLGPQITVQPENLLRALIAWKSTAGTDPREFLDRIEGVLRGRLPTAA